MTSFSQPPKTTYDPRYFPPLFAAEEKHFWFKSRNGILARIINKLIRNQPEGYRLLEVGCGTGNVLRMLEKTCTGGIVVGMDLFADGLRFARRRVSVPLVQGDIVHPPFKSGLDIICMYDVLEHLPDDLNILQSVHKLMKKEGRLLLTVPADPRLWSFFDTASHHYRRYTKADLVEVMEKSGFSVEFISPYMMVIYPLVWLVRRLTGKISRQEHLNEQQIEKKSIDELAIIPVINEILTWLLNLEGMFLATGMRLPVGTSLVAIGRKET